MTDICHHRLIAILRGISPEECEPVVTRLLDAGITAIEVPLNSPRPFESIAIASRLVSSYLGKEGLVGAGTVLSADEVDKVANSGGNVIVSPDCHEPVIARTLARKMISLPGVFTPTEAHKAIRAGANGLKLFPASLLGPSAVRALKAVLPANMPLYAVGGVALEDMADYAAAGITGFGIGSAIYQTGDTADDVGNKAQDFINHCHKIYGASATQ